MRLAPLALTCLALLAVPATASARIDAPAPKGPTGLKAFLLRAEEPAAHQFSRTPSFAWSPVRGAMRYEFELATSKRFNGSAIVWSNVKDELEEQPGTTTAPASGSGSAATTPAASVYDFLRSPAVALDIALPWVTGNPYALYAHVRAITKSGPTPWSEPYGFNVRWDTVPKDQQSPYQGLVRWSPVDGATAYEVWMLGARQTFMTPTNVADARDLFTFHRTPQWTSAVSYRVRAVRKLYGEVASGLAATSYGPWSPIFTNVQPGYTGGTLHLGVAISDVVGSGAGAAHDLTPGFTFTGDSGGPLDFTGGAPAELFRVYVATDADCVNIVYRSAIVGSPAYAPRLTGPLELPDTDLKVAAARTRVLKHGKEPADNFMLDGTLAVTTEQAASSSSSGSSSGSSGSGSSGSSSGGSGSASAATAIAPVDLPDTAWPEGGYYWTVVPVIWILKQELTTPPAAGQGTPIEYHETELPQDACQSGRVQRFGKTSSPVVTSTTRPFASGLSPKGRLVSATRSTPSFYGTPLVAWQPAAAAQEYEVQWSKTANPWRPVGSLKTGATSALLPLAPGSWHYRVRGYNHALPKRPQMAWSDPVALRVAAPTFRIVGK
jgi:uncharacterized membrane protein YgcG